jgi:hypothetical protein
MQEEFYHGEDFNCAKLKLLLISLDSYFVGLTFDFFARWEEFTDEKSPG